MRRIQILDTHTGGEPTRVVVAGGPGLGDGSLYERRVLFQSQFDHFRSAIINEPRGSDVLVGALLVPPVDPSCIAGVLFFNNIGYLGTCGHGTIGVVVALGYLGRLTAGLYHLETPVGVVSVDFDGSNSVALDNVPSYRHLKHVRLRLPQVSGEILGDVAWGGNWFFLIDAEANEAVPYPGRASIEELTNFSRKVRQALSSQGITGAQGAEIDHIEIFGPAQPVADSQNFVLCPGLAYDRSPCGTGTSAKLACLYADGKLQPGQKWRQQSVIGSIFEGSVREVEGKVLPRIAGTAYVTSEATLLLDERDPFAWGIR